VSLARFFIAASAGLVAGVWTVCLLLAFGDGGVRLDGSQQGKFVLGYFLMIYGPPLIVGGLTYFALRKNRQV
jgi:hypothetical protein